MSKLTVGSIEDSGLPERAPAESKWPDGSSLLAWGLLGLGAVVVLGFL
jgi:hypothetical protein